MIQPFSFHHVSFRLTLRFREKLITMAHHFRMALSPTSYVFSIKSTNNIGESTNMYYLHAPKSNMSWWELMKTYSYALDKISWLAAGEQHRVEFEFVTRMPVWTENNFKMIILPKKGLSVQWADWFKLPPTCILCKIIKMETFVPSYFRVVVHRLINMRE